MAIYTCVLLDVDNTILDFDAAERQALTDMLAEYELPHDEAAYDTYHKVNRELWDSLAKGPAEQAEAVPDPLLPLHADYAAARQRQEQGHE